MSGLEILWWLIVGHFLCDFALQSDAMAVGKNRHANLGIAVPWQYWMLAHSFIHGGMVALVTGLPVLGLLETALHYWIDTAKCNKVTDIHIDQALHAVCKVLWVWIAIGASQ